MCSWWKDGGPLSSVACLRLTQAMILPYDDPQLLRDTAAFLADVQIGSAANSRRRPCYLVRRL